MFMSYQLTPINLRPPVRISRSTHTKYVQSIENAVLGLRDEKEIVDGSNPKASELLSTLDSVFAHGLLAGNRCYWHFVKEFLPKNESELMEVEWTISNMRNGNKKITRLSFAWLKDSFNRSSLYFQLLAILAARKTVKQYYHSSACCRNYGAFERIVNQIGLLESVQFAFDSEFREDGPLGKVILLPIACEAEPEDRKTNGRQSKAAKRELEEARAKEEIVPRTDITIPTPARPIAQNNVHQDIILQDLMRHRRTRMHGYYNQLQQAEELDVVPRVTVDHSAADEVEPERPEERLDEVLQKTISQVRLEHVDSVAKSFDQMLLSEKFAAQRKEEEEAEERRRKKEADEENLVGDIALHSGEVLRFAMDIFMDVDEGEKFQRLFHVFDGAPSEERARLLLITDRNLYLLTQSIVEGQVGGSSEDIQVEYHTHVIMPLPNVEYFEMTAGGLIITVYAAAGKTFTINDNGTANDRIVAITTADPKLGRIILETIIMGVRSLGHKTPAIYHTNTPFDLILRRYISKQNSASPDLRHMFITFWAETPRSIKEEDAIEPSYLFRRESSKGWLVASGSEWMQSYFVLRDCKLYVFSDSTCHDGQKVIDLSSMKEFIVTEEPDTEYPNVISLPLQDTTFHISFPSLDEKNRWVHALHAANCQIPESTVSSAVLFVTDSNIIIGQLGSNAHVDGFIRTLAIYKIELLRECIFYTVDGYTTIILGVEDNFEWFMLRTKEEVKRFHDHFSNLVKCYDAPDFPESERLMPLIEQQRRKYPSIWSISVFVTGNDALEFDAGDNNDDCP